MDSGSGLLQSTKDKIDVPNSARGRGLSDRNHSKIGGYEFRAKNS
jgi:hypothetical protein